MSMIGKRLAHYDITSLIGKGGMGEVYQAKDQKLGRDVAIKVLPAEFAKDSDRIARFQREAKLLASLNHPNIASIHGLEVSDGTHFLVLELIEGQTLADRIKAGPIPVEEALKLALQMAEALEAAHEKGVIHRDLKPANIKVTPDGKVKVLDFGLAKAYAGDPGNMNLSNSPTLSDIATQQGVILGTSAYMPPEQVKGKTVDKRADIWAFGVVLFEMLTGRQLFTGETVSETLASVLKTEPEWNQLPHNLHPRIRFLLERCLEKDPRNRYGAISDARVDIQKVLTDPGGAMPLPVAIAEPRSKLRTALPWVAAIILAAIAIGTVVWNMQPESGSHQITRFDYDVSDMLTEIGPRSILAVSPDGRQLIYSTAKGLYMRPTGELDARHIAGTGRGDSIPFFSPDGKWVGYYSLGKLKKTAVSGGSPVVLCDSGIVLGATWNADNTIIYADSTRGIMRISAAGGTPEPLIEETMCSCPQLLPDGKSLLFARVIQQEIVVQSLGSGAQKVLFPGAMAQYLPTGHIVYLSRTNNALDFAAVPFDPETLEVTGDPVPIVKGIREVAVSNSGMLAYLSGGLGSTAPGRTLVWVDRQGKEEPLPAPPNVYHFPRISPDGTKVAIAIGDALNSDIWTWDLERKNLMRLTFNKGPDSVPVWTPDGKRITFFSNRNDGTGIYWQSADGTGEAEQIVSKQNRIILPYSWSKDGNTLVLLETPDMNRFDIAVMSMEGDRTPKPLLQEEYGINQPQLSPDGRWIAYCTNESGSPEIYVRPFPNVNGGRWQVSTQSGNSPMWSPNGKELFYLIGITTAGAVTSVPVETVPTFKPGTPKILFGGTYVGFYPQDGIPYDVHPDGTRFLMMRQSTSANEQSSAQSTPKITVVLNWFEELKQKVPVP